MVAADGDGMAPIWCQGICDYYEDRPVGPYNEYDIVFELCIFYLECLWFYEHISFY